MSAPHSPTLYLPSPPILLSHPPIQTQTPNTQTQTLTPRLFLSLQDILINNAGLGHHVHALDYDDASARNVFDVDYWGTLAVTKAFAPLLIEAGKAASRGEGGVKGKGVVVNVCSIAAVTWVPTFGSWNLLSLFRLLSAIMGWTGPFFLISTITISTSLTTRHHYFILLLLLLFP